MFKKYFICILFFFSFYTVSLSQNNSGYLGKKAYVEYNLDQPLFYVLILRTKVKSPKLFNFTHNLRFNYIASRRLQMSLSFDTYSFQGINNNDVFEDPVQSLVKGSSIGIGIDRYSKMLIAPVGLYYRLEGKYLFGKFEESDLRELKNIASDNYTAISVGFGYGIRRVFFDKMVFNVGGSHSFIFNIKSSTGTDYKQALAGYSFWKMNVGIGWLLF